MQMMLAEPMLSESDLQIGKQSLARVGIGLSKYLIYLRKQHWLETSGPYLRFLQEKAKAYEKYLPPGYTIPE
uniref:Uncharacterized protein n=1 Tax=Romanomermis culicivorax TaxID=13658 RepID=A0A915K1M8_ROMCU